MESVYISTISLGHAPHEQLDAASSFMGSPGHPFRIALIWHPSLSSHPRSLLNPLCAYWLQPRAWQCSANGELTCPSQHASMGGRRASLAEQLPEGSGVFEAVVFALVAQSCVEHIPYLDHDREVEPPAALLRGRLCAFSRAHACKPLRACAPARAHSGPA